MPHLIRCIPLLDCILPVRRGTDASPGGLVLVGECGRVQGLSLVFFRFTSFLGKSSLEATRSSSSSLDSTRSLLAILGKLGGGDLVAVTHRRGDRYSVVVEVPDSPIRSFPCSRFLPNPPSTLWVPLSIDASRPTPEPRAVHRHGIWRRLCAPCDRSRPTVSPLLQNLLGPLPPVLPRTLRA